MAWKDLLKVSGLPIRVDDTTGVLEWRGDGPGPVAAPVTLADLQNVRMQPESPGGSDPAYHVYQDAGLPRDREQLAAAGLVYHLTLVPPGKLGPEFNKTHGHYESHRPGGLSSAHVVEVLLGTALVLCQKAAVTNPGEVEDAVVMEVETGQKGIVPPGYGHVIINPGKRVLVVAELESRSPEHLYIPYRNWRGACYYCTVGADREPEFVENPRYTLVADLRMVPVEEEYSQLGLEEGMPLYVSAVRHPERFGWVGNPEAVAGLLVFPELDEGNEDDDEE